MAGVMMDVDRLSHQVRDKGNSQQATAQHLLSGLLHRAARILVPDADLEEALQAAASGRAIRPKGGAVVARG